MNHADVEEQEVLDRYLRGRLSEEEAVQFEQHYLSCSACLDQLESAEGLERGLKRAVVQDASQVAAARQLAVVAWLARLGRSRQAALLATGLLLVLLVPGLALRRAGELDRELQQNRAAMAEMAAESGSARSEGDSEAARLRSALEASRRARDRERQVAAENLAAAQQAAAAERAAARQPQVNLPLLFLEPQRGGPEPEPTHRLRLPAQAGWAVLSLTVEPPHPPSYRVTLRGPGGREVWEETGLHPDALDVLTLGLPTELLAPGDYQLVIEGPAAAGRPRSLNRFPFRVLPPG